MEGNSQRTAFKERNTHMTASDQGSVTNRMNELAVETTQTFIDAAYLAQRQSTELLQAWLRTLDASQQEQREIASKLIRQTQEAQSLLQQFAQQSVQASANAFSTAAQTGLNTASENFQRAAETVRETKTAQ
jgi:hypothetical protein